MREKTPRDLLTADAEGWTAIHEAGYYGQAECLKLLLTGERALMPFSSRNSNKTSSPDQHIRSGCDQREGLTSSVFSSYSVLSFPAVPEMINTRTQKHQTPLILAVSREHFLCVQYLLEKGANPGIPTITNETPLYEGDDFYHYIQELWFILQHGDFISLLNSYQVKIS